MSDLLTGFRSDKEMDFLYKTLLPRMGLEIETVVAEFPELDGPAMINVLRFREECVKAGTTPEAEFRDGETVTQAVNRLTKARQRTFREVQEGRFFTESQWDSIQGRVIIARSMGLDRLADNMEQLLQDPDASEARFSRYIQVCNRSGVVFASRSEKEQQALTEAADLYSGEEEPF